MHKFLNLTGAEFAAALSRAGLAAPSMMAPLDRLASDVSGVIADAKTLGAQFVSCPWIPHEGDFTRAHADHAIEVLTTAGRALKSAGLRLVYHVHGYELSGHGLGSTLLDHVAVHRNRGRGF